MPNTTPPPSGVIFAPALEKILVPVKEIREHPDNPRRGNVEAIKASILANGVYRAITAQRSTGHVLVGNHTLKALTELGAEKVPVVWVEADDDTARRIVLADNRTSDLGEYDDKALADMLAELKVEDLEGVGYTQDDLKELAELIGDPEDLLTEPDDTETTVDELPPLPDKPKTQRGDVWILGPHRVMCGDCTNSNNVEALDVTGVRTILSDPPYCSGGFQESGKSVGSIGTSAKAIPIANDRLSTRGYQALMRAMLEQVQMDFVYLFTDWRMWNNLFDIVEANGLGVRSMIVWDKKYPGMGRGWRTQHELIMWSTRVTAPWSNKFPGAGNVISVNRTGNGLHPTQKPVELIRELLRVVPFSDVIYDPFSGSGTTLIACHEEGRVARCMELSPAYVDVICRRWQEITGERPVLESTGEAVDFGPADE